IYEFHDPTLTNHYTLSLHDALPIYQRAMDQMPLGILLYNKDRRIEWHNPFVRGMTDEEELVGKALDEVFPGLKDLGNGEDPVRRSEEHTSELQSRENLVCRLLLEKK